jgi:hypothetical protein
VLRRVNSPSRLPLPANDLTASNRLSRRSAHQPRSSNSPACLPPNHLERIVSQLKQEYAQEARLSRYSQLAKAKSEHNFTQASKPKPAGEEGKSSIQQLQ